MISPIERLKVSWVGALYGKDSRFSEVELGYQSGSYLSGKSLS